MLQDVKQLPWAGFLTVICWSLSPTFVRLGLDDLDAPILAVMIGLVANVFPYGILLYIRRKQWMGRPIERTSLNWQILAGILVGLATWARWVSIDLEEVAVALALSRINVPIVLVLSIFWLDQGHERITWKVLVGASLIVGGSILLTLAG